VIHREQALAELHGKLGYKRLNRTWAKLEILLGLAATGAGLLLDGYWLAQTGPRTMWLFPAAGLTLFILGGYLAMAGHRSHLYQSANERTAYLAEIIRSMKDKG
jgi:LPXTG-motif cell wall-anchored protein